MFLKCFFCGEVIEKDNLWPYFWCLNCDLDIGWEFYNKKYKTEEVDQIRDSLCSIIRNKNPQEFEEEDIIKNDGTVVTEGEVI